MKLKIGLVDDHQVLLSALKEILSIENFDVVLEANNGQEMIDKLKQFSYEDFPEIIVTDISMPIMDGFQTIQWIKSNYPEISVIVLSAFETTDLISKTLKLGASAFLNKCGDMNTLIEAINSVATKGYYIQENVSRILVDSVQKTNETILSEKEIEIMRLIASQYTAAEIAAELSINPRTIEGYRSGIIKKLNLKNVAGIVTYAFKNGFLNMKNT